MIKKLMAVTLTLCLAFGVSPLSAQAATKGKSTPQNRDSQKETTVTDSTKTKAATGSAITITLDQTAANVVVSKQTVVKATVSVTTANKNAKKNKKFNSVKWTSSDTTVAKVSNGTVTGLKPGTATITATVQGSTDVTATCTITVLASSTPKDDYLALLKAKKFTTEQIALVETKYVTYTDAEWETLLESAMVMTKTDWNALRKSLTTTTDTSATDTTTTTTTTTA